MLALEILCDKKQGGNETQIHPKNEYSLQEEKP